MISPLLSQWCVCIYMYMYMLFVCGGWDVCTCCTCCLCVVGGPVCVVIDATGMLSGNEF